MFQAGDAHRTALSMGDCGVAVLEGVVHLAEMGQVVQLDLVTALRRESREGGGVTDAAWDNKE